MNYLTNYYKNLSEQLQEKVNHLQKMLDEANIRSPTEHLKATRDTSKGGLFRLSSGWDRMNQMIHFKAAHAIADPHEQEAIEAVLTDMAQTKRNAPGTAANMQSMRTAFGAVKRLKGTDAFTKSLSAVRDPIERESFERAQDSFNPFYGADISDYRAGGLTDRENEAMEDEIFDVSQEKILGKPRTFPKFG